LLCLRALGQPFGIGRKGIPLLFALGQAVPGQHVVERLIGFADEHGPEPGLADAVLLPKLESDRLEAIEQSRKAARDAVVNPELVDHGVSFRDYSRASAA